MRQQPHAPHPGGNGRGRFRAPIDYAEVGTRYQTVRLTGSIVGAVIGVALWLQDFEYAELIVVAAALLAVHAVIERRRNESALATLVIDSTIVGLVGLLFGNAGGAIGSGLVYVVTGSLLLLPLRTAGYTIGYAGLWLAVSLLFGRRPAAVDTIAIDLVGIGAATALVAQLLYSTGQALFSAEARHREALASERRAVELKDEFVSMVSHELRTPLTSIVGFAETLRESWPNLTPKEIGEFLLIMRGEANHLSNLVEDILVIPRLEAGRLRLEPETMRLRDEAFEVSRLVFGGTTRELQVDVPADIFVLADPNRLRQIFRNLLENARKYGGDQVLVTGERLGDQFKVVIADNGAGIPVNDRERIFEHFEQAVKGDARSEGVGLGLPIARKLARAMGGDLWFEPRFPTGAQFLFTVNTVEGTPDSIPLQRTTENVPT